MSNALISRNDIVYHETQIVPVNKNTLINNRIIAAQEDDPCADVFRILRTKVLQRMSINDSRVLAVTSPTSSVGKSLIAVNLSVSIALDTNLSVILIDMDIRRPSIHKYFGLSASNGIIDYCLENKPIEDLLINPGINSLVILPAGKATKRSSQILSNLSIDSFIQELKRRYPNRMVILDFPPLLPTDDALVLLPHIEACILVAAEGQTSKEEIERSMNLIDQKKYIGTIFNKSTNFKGYEY